MNKKRTNQRLLAVDPGLTCSGWALFELDSDQLSGVGRVRSTPPSSGLSLYERLELLQGSIVSLFESMKIGEGDYLVVEAPTTMKDPMNVIKVEQVRGIFETLARSRGVRVPGRVNPRSIHKNLLGMRGSQLARDVVKQAAVTVVHVTYREVFGSLGFPSDIENLHRHQDIVDAVLVGDYAKSQIKGARAAGQSEACFFQNDGTKRRRR